MTLEKSCDFCGEEDESYLYKAGEGWLCSVHMCSLCGEEGHARDGGTIYCDTCYLSEGEGAECESCGRIEHIDQMAGTVCQGCDDRAIFYGSFR